MAAIIFYMVKQHTPLHHQVILINYSDIICSFVSIMFSWLVCSTWNFCITFLLNLIFKEFLIRTKGTVLISISFLLSTCQYWNLSLQPRPVYSPNISALDLSTTEARQINKKTDLRTTVERTGEIKCRTYIRNLLKKTDYARFF